MKIKILKWQARIYYTHTPCEHIGMEWDGDEEWVGARVLSQRTPCKLQFNRDEPYASRESLASHSVSVCLHCAVSVTRD